MSSWNPSLPLRPIKDDMLREGYVHIHEFPLRDFTKAQAGAINTVGMCFPNWSDQMKSDLTPGS